jgi:hypothetical protein
LVEISDGIFKPAFVALDTPVIETRFETARIEFKGAIEIRHRAVHLSLIPEADCTSIAHLGRRKLAANWLSRFEIFWSVIVDDESWLYRLPLPQAKFLDFLAEEACQYWLSRAYGARGAAPPDRRIAVIDHCLNPAPRFDPAMTLILNKSNFPLPYMG